MTCPELPRESEWSQEKNLGVQRDLFSTASDSGLQFSAHSAEKRTYQRMVKVEASVTGYQDPLWIAEKDSLAQGDVHFSRPRAETFIFVSSVAPRGLCLVHRRLLMAGCLNLSY